MPRGYPESTPGVDFRSQGVISRRFKRKNKFCDERTNGWTDRRDGRNSGLDSISEKGDPIDLLYQTRKKGNFHFKDT